jgi:hypothetical protein
MRPIVSAGLLPPDALAEPVEGGGALGGLEGAHGGQAGRGWKVPGSRRGGQVVDARALGPPAGLRMHPLMMWSALPSGDRVSEGRWATATLESFMAMTMLTPTATVALSSRLVKV